MRYVMILAALAACDSPGGSASEPHLFDGYAEGVDLCQQVHESLCAAFWNRDDCSRTDIDQCLAISFYLNLTDCQGADADVNWRPCLDALEALACTATEDDRTKAFDVCVSVAYPHGAGPKAPHDQ